ARGVPFFFKQWGGVNKKRTGRLLEGRTWDDMPAAPSCKATPDKASRRSATQQLALV
ncbi:MAG: phage Gp37/Gp68 family protein, partial [Chloroflexota bacterium]|nr:phage Gp37/Gp68 family protein [Chloroflexota bacterium]